MVIGIDARFMLHGCVHPHSRLAHILLRRNRQDTFPAKFVLYTDREPDETCLTATYAAANVAVRVLGPTGGRMQRLRWLWFALPAALVRDGAEVFYSSFYFLPRRTAGVRLINSIHDCCVFYIDPRLNRGLLAHPTYLKVLKPAMRWTNRRAHATVTVSHFSGEMLRRHLGLPAERIRVCYHGLEEWATETPPEGKYFLFVGSNLPKKNIRQYLAGYARLPAEVRSAYRLKLKTDCHPENVEQIRQLNIAANVDFISGRLEGDAMARLFAGAQLVLLLSYDEGFGLPIIEAFAANVPVLVSNRSACDELVTMPECKADPDDTAEITRKWLALTTDPELRERCLQEQRRRRELFSLRRTADAFFAAITV